MNTLNTVIIIQCAVRIGTHNSQFCNLMSNRPSSRRQHANRNKKPTSGAAGLSFHPRKHEIPGRIPEAKAALSSRKFRARAHPTHNTCMHRPAARCNYRRVLSGRDAIARRFVRAGPMIGFIASLRLPFPLSDIIDAQKSWSCRFSLPLFLPPAARRISDSNKRRRRLTSIRARAWFFSFYFSAVRRASRELAGVERLIRLAGVDDFVCGSRADGCDSFVNWNEIMGYTCLVVE